MMKWATLCYVRRGEQTLMLHRVKKQGDMHKGKWNGLGGKLLPGETPEACVIREVEEESGLQLYRPELRGILTFPRFYLDEDWYAFVFVADTFSGTLIESNEGVLQWIDNDRLLELNLWDGDRVFIPWLARPGFFSARFDYKDGQYLGHVVEFYGAGDTNGLDAERELQAAPHPTASDSNVAGASNDEESCWLCGGPVMKHHCKITCTVCGFRRDCSDP